MERRSARRVVADCSLAVTAGELAALAADADPGEPAADAADGTVMAADARRAPVRVAVTIVLRVIVGSCRPSGARPCALAVANCASRSARPPYLR
jgi:hypothetical protein